MGTAFDTFPQYGLGHYAGQLADRNHADVVSRIASGSDIGFGLAVIDTDVRTAKLPTGTEVSNGITVREFVHENDGADTPAYAQGEAMSVVRVGRIWVETVDGAALGDDVYVVPDTGALTNTDNAGANIQLPNAAFQSAAAAGEMALVQLNGS